MCHTVIDWPLILPLNLAYPRQESRLIKLVRWSFNSQYPLPGFPEENYDTLEYSKVKCYSGDSVRLRNLYSIEHKKHQQAFLAPLPGKQMAKDIVE